MKKVYLFFIFLFSLTLSAQEIALVKYAGGGDWYANPTSLPNLIKFCNKNINTKIKPKPGLVEPSSPDLFSYPYVHMTGHGNVVFSSSDVENLRNYMNSGGFLHIDDNYGLNPYVRPQMKKVFPELDFVELPFSHPVYHQKYNFNKGLPKIHEHDGKPSLGFGLVYEGRLVVFYSFECNLGNGWELERNAVADSFETRKAWVVGSSPTMERY